MEKILVVGVTGMLGNSLAKTASDEFEVIGTYNRFVHNGLRLDIINKDEVDRVISSVRPDLVVNCAAVTDVDLCEEQPALANAVHVKGTESLSEACARHNAKFIHISTDFVFDGSKGNYSEGHEANPVNVYGRTKHEGEQKTKGRDLVLRTCIFGKNVGQKKSVVEWIVDELSIGRQINMFNDSFFTPMYTGHLAEIILEARRKDLHGLFHVASTERVDKLTFAEVVAEVYGLDAGLIKPSSILTFNRKVKRPADTSLDCSKIMRHGIRLNNFREEIEMMKND